MLPVDGRRGAGVGEASMASATSWLAAWSWSPAMLKAFLRLKTEVLFLAILEGVNAFPVRLVARRRVAVSLDEDPGLLALVLIGTAIASVDDELTRRFFLPKPGARPGGKGGGVLASRWVELPAPGGMNNGCRWLGGWMVKVCDCDDVRRGMRRGDPGGGSGGEWQPELDLRDVLPRSVVLGVGDRDGLEYGVGDDEGDSRSSIVFSSTIFA
jgi:hypothetical protein